MADNISEQRTRAWVMSGIDESGLAALEATLPPSQLWSLLLDVLERRAGARTSATVLRQWMQDRFVTPSYIDSRTLLALDTELFAAASAFEAIELSPLAPLGTCSSIALTTQNRIVSTVRGTEVVSDPTNVLALECARRLRGSATTVYRLATSHRCVRAQEIPDRPGFAAHFRIFCLATAGREIKDQGLLVAACSEHIQTHLAGLDRLERCGYRFADRIVQLLSTPARRDIAQRIANSLPGIAVVHEPLTQAYYSGGLRFMINAGNEQGVVVPLIDGGAFDWVAQLAANRKLVFVASAIGSQLAAYLYRTTR